MGWASSPDSQAAYCAPILRHFALCAATLIAYLARQELHVGNSVLWLLGCAAVLNLATGIFSCRPVPARMAAFLSPLFGLGSWISLMLLTGGIASPFVAGLFLEIALAAVAGSLATVAWVTVGGVAGLWALTLLPAGGDSWLMPALQTGFLLGTAAVTCYVALRRERSSERLVQRQAEIQSRLNSLEQDLEDARRLGKMGENVARLAHGFKNAVHSLRGYRRLIEPRLTPAAADVELLQGLTTAIDGLEELARATLGTGGPTGRSSPEPPAADACAIVREVVRDVGTSFPELQWSISLLDGPPLERPASSLLREILTIVARNAAEAMGGRGEVVVETAPRNGHLEIRVRDHGPGIPPSVGGALFNPGYTTKPEGHGLGLFLARRLLEDRGGFLSLSSAQDGGTVCRIELPCQEST